jgi:hypothetical protein
MSYRKREAKGGRMLDFAMFAAGIVIAAFAIIGGLYLLFRHTRRMLPARKLQHSKRANDILRR